MYERILVPLDGSGLAEKALNHAKTLATACGSSTIDLVFVVEPLHSAEARVYGQDYEEIVSQYTKKTEAWGKEYLGKVSKSLVESGIKTKSIVLVGNPAEMILDYSAKSSVDLIVMSTHGRSGLTRWAMGSVAERVKSGSTVPVLMVRA